MDTEKQLHLSEVQKKVVGHSSGAMRVCAGPGTGKTTAMVARAIRLMEEGVAPSRILIITYSKRAADEIRGCFQGEDAPVVKTLHAIGYQIILRNQSVIGTKKLATHVDHMLMLQGLIRAIPVLPQFDESDQPRFIKSMEQLLKTFNYINLLGKEEYLRKYPDKDNERLFLVKAMFEQKITEGGYITYDEQIKYAVKILENYPDIRQSVAREYEYIHIDEAQDMDYWQIKLIRMLVKQPENNIVVFGDVDQAIYGFRGGSSDFLLNFMRYYPMAKDIIFNENYRSTQEILNAANTLISHNINRVSNQIKAQNVLHSIRPVWLKHFGVNRIGDLVQDIVKRQGYKFEQIAIIARNNADLERAGRMFDFYNKENETINIIKYELPKYYLYQDHAFRILLDILSISVRHYEDNDAWLRLLSIYGIRMKKGYKRFNIYEEYLKYGAIYAFDSEEAQMYYLLSENDTHIIGGFAKIYRLSQYFLLPLEDAVSEVFRQLFEKESSKKPILGIILNLIRERRMKSPLELWTYMNGMYQFRDNTRIWYTNEKDRLHMLTAHDAKGKQYPVVIIYGADKFETGDVQEDRRVLYVAMTRAERILIITEEHSGKSTLLKETEENFNIVGGMEYA